MPDRMVDNALRRAGIGIVVCCAVVATAGPLESTGQSIVRAAGVDASKEAVRSLTVQPSRIDLRESRAEHGFLVSLTGPGGRPVDVTGKCRITTSDATVLTIMPDGHCAAVADGATEALIEYQGLTARLPVTVSGASQPRPPSFRQEIVPLLTANGCSAGGCHGKLAGQNGFRLSLRGYAPEQDYLSLTSELASRRINFAAPAESLLVQKPAGAVPHEGGVRLAEGSRGQRELIEWIASRAPGADAAESDAASLEILPGNRELVVGESQHLLVLAHYPDQTVRDVTWLTQFYSNDEATVSVTRGGLAKALRPGSTAVRAHFQGKVGVVILTTPFPNDVQHNAYVTARNVIDGPLFRKLESLHLPPAERCDDSAFVRRAFLDTIGTLPTPAEARAFVVDSSPDKRAKLIDQLLGRPEFVDFWTLQLGDLLQNRKERDHDVRGVKGVRAFQNWLHDQIAADRKWDQIARDVLLSKGDSGSVPQIGYYIVTVGEKQNVEESDVADGVAMSFLGSRIGCARCHNHPLEKYTQDDYYHFAAYFSRVTLKRQEVAKGPTTLLVASRDEENLGKQIAQAEKGLADAKNAADGKAGDEAKKAAAKVAEAEKRLADAKKQLASARAKAPGVNQPRTGKFMAPQTLDGSAIDWHPGEDPREALVAWMTSPKNENFSGNMVNRLWKHFMGVGLVEQVDDLRSSNPPSNPELWAVLNGEFVGHAYDLKHVMQLILNSRAYQLSSTTSSANEQDHRFYSHYYARRLPAEVFSDALAQATGVPDSFPGYPVGTRAVQLPEPGVGSYFLTMFGRSDRVTACACERTEDVTLPQLLHLGNGDTVVGKLRSGEGSVASLVKEKDDKAIDELFWSTVCRAPTAVELAAVKQALASGDPREEVLRDLLWALLNSKGFAFNH